MTILNNFKRRLALFIGANGDNITSVSPTGDPKPVCFYTIFGERRFLPYINGIGNSMGYSDFDSSSSGVLSSTSSSSLETSSGFIRQVEYVTEDFNIVENEYLQATDGENTLSTVIPARTFQNNVEIGKNGLVLKYTNQTENPVTIYGFFTYLQIYPARSYEIATQTWISSNTNERAPLIAVKFDQPVTLEAGKTITTIYDIDFSNI